MADLLNGNQQQNGIKQNDPLTALNGGLNSGQSQQADDIFGGFDSEEDKNLNELLSGFGTEVDDDFEVGDDWLAKPKKDGEEDDSLNLGDDEDAEGKAMMTEIQQMLSQVSIKDDQLPADFDWSDRDKVKKLLNHTAQQAAVSAMAIISKPMKKFVEDTVKNLREEMGKTVEKGSIKSRITDAFAPFKEQLSGEQNKSKLAFAVSTYKQALSTQKDPRKAALLAQRMLKQIGINVNLQRGNNSNEPVHSQRLEGRNALDDIFGPMSK